MGKKDKLKKAGNVVKAVSAFKAGAEAEQDSSTAVLDSFAVDLPIPKKKQSKAVAAAEDSETPAAEVKESVSPKQPAKKKKKKAAGKNKTLIAAASSGAEASVEEDSLARSQSTLTDNIEVEVEKEIDGAADEPVVDAPEEENIPEAQPVEVEEPKIVVQEKKEEAEASAPSPKPVSSKKNKKKKNVEYEEAVLVDDAVSGSVGDVDSAVDDGFTAVVNKKREKALERGRKSELAEAPQPVAAAVPIEEKFPVIAAVPEVKDETVIHVVHSEKESHSRPVEEFRIDLQESARRDSDPADETDKLVSNANDEETSTVQPVAQTEKIFMEHPRKISKNDDELTVRSPEVEAKTTVASPRASSPKAASIPVSGEIRIDLEAAQGKSLHVEAKPLKPNDEETVTSPKFAQLEVVHPETSSRRVPKNDEELSYPIQKDEIKVSSDLKVQEAQITHKFEPIEPVVDHQPVKVVSVAAASKLDATPGEAGAAPTPTPIVTSSSPPRQAGAITSDTRNLSPTKKQQPAYIKAEDPSKSEHSKSEQEAGPQTKLLPGRRKDSADAIYPKKSFCCC